MIPDYFEAITAYRCWNAFPNGLLVGQAHYEPWAPYQAFIARCGLAREAHVRDGQWQEPPVFACDCGVHALKALAHTEARIVEEKLRTIGGLVTFYYDDYKAPQGRVWGEVKLWGRLIEHEIGYRAEFAYPGELFCEDEKLAAVVAELYGVPCRVKALAMPKPKDGEVIFLSTSWGGSSFYYQPQTWYGIGSTITVRAPAKYCPKPLVQMVPAVGASRHQKREAAKRIAPSSEKDWRTVMYKGFHAKKSVDGMTDADEL